MTAGGDRAPGGLSRGYLMVLVTVTGAAVLVLEVLGTRVIGTHYGSSLYVWAALLSVTLVCLAVGYALGGRLADRVPRAWMLHLLVVLAGSAVLLVPPLTAVLVPLGEALGLTCGAVASAGVIFFAPLTLLAMAGPYVIRLRARRVGAVGSTSGAVYALSTFGSVAGVFAVSFWLIPSVGTRASLLACSGVLMALGGLGLALGTRGRAAPVLLLAALPAVVPAGRRRLPGELYHTESPYGDLRVIEPPGTHHRMLVVNGIMQTGMPVDMHLLGPGAALKADSYYLELLPYFHPDLGVGRRGVLIGLAGGMFPRVMEFYDIHWTAVEIDVKVAELARAYFGYRGRIYDRRGRPHPVDLSAFPDRALPGDDDRVHRPSGPYRGRAVIEDGRRYLRRHVEAADFIVLDAYNSDSIPFHLITREFFRLVRRRLTADGILAINYIGRPRGDAVTDALFRTLVDVFGPGSVRAWRTTDDPDDVQVIIVFAFRSPMELLPLWRVGPGGGADRLSYELSRRRLRIDPPAGPVITDDLNPIDLARARTAIAWRRRTLRYLR